MRLGKLCWAVLLGATPATALAQPSAGVDVSVNVGTDSYASVAPGDPVESVDVFYDQLSPYGVWVDEPDVGRVFIPATADYVPFTAGHWEYTNVGFVWVSSEPFAWATSHYGRWAFSNNYGRWYWSPDTEWGPAWVEWRQTGADFGWAPLPPAVLVRTGWQPPIDSWHYCGSDHILDVDVSRYYEPRARVVEIQREAKPIEHYSTISDVKVVVGPPAATLRARHVEARPVTVEARTVGRWTAPEAKAQVASAREHHAAFEAQNQRRIESDSKIQAAQVKVIEAHPQIKAQVTARAQVAAGHPAQPAAVAPKPAAPKAVVPPTHPSTAHQASPAPARVAPKAGDEPVAPAGPARRAPEAPAASKPDERSPAQHAPAPRPREQVAPSSAAHPPAHPTTAEPKAPPHARPEPEQKPPVERAQPQPEAKQPEAKRPETKQPEARQPEVKQPEAKRPEARQPEAKRPEDKQPENR